MSIYEFLLHVVKIPYKYILNIDTYNKLCTMHVLRRTVKTFINPFELSRCQQ